MFRISQQKPAFHVRRDTRCQSCSLPHVFRVPLSILVSRSVHETMAQPMLRLSDNNTISTNLSPCFDAYPRIDVFHEHQILVTEGQHVVAVHNRRDNLPLRSWTFSQLHPLSSPVVYDRIRKKFVAVLSGIEIRIFSLEQEIEESERYKFHRPIRCVLFNPDGETIVMFDDGDINFLTEALNNRTEESLSNRKMDKIVGVKVLLTGSRSYSSSRPVDVVTLTAASEKKIEYNRLRIDTVTKIVSRCESFELPADFLVQNISEDGAIGGLTGDGTVVVHRNGVKTSVSLGYQPKSQSGSQMAITSDAGRIPMKHLKHASAFLFFPHQEHVVAVVHQITVGAYVITAVDMRYGTFESYPMQSIPLVNGVTAQNDRLFILTAKGIQEKEFLVSPKPLSCIFVEDSKVAELLSKESGQKRPSVDHFEGMTTQDIILAFKKQRTEAGIQNERRMAQLMQHLVTHDPQLTTTQTDQLVEQILRMPFSTSFLVKELRALHPRLEAKQGLLLAHKFMDRLDEHDQYSQFCGEITNSLLDVCMTQILVQQNELQDLLFTLVDKTDHLLGYFKSSTHLKSMVDSLTKGQRVRPGKPEYERRMTRI